MTHLQEPVRHYYNHLQEPVRHYYNFDCVGCNQSDNENAHKHTWTFSQSEYNFIKNSTGNVILDCPICRRLFMPLHATDVDIQFVEQERATNLSTRVNSSLV